MESSWSYDSGGDKGFMLSNGTVSANTNWGLKGPSSYSYDHHVNTMFQNPFDSQSNLGVGFTGVMMRKQSSHDSLRNCLSSNGSGGGDVINIRTFASNAVSGDEESSSRQLSNSMADSNSRESSLIDLKLGRFGDNLGYNATMIRTGRPVMSTPAKRVRASSSLNSQPAFCQVYGCSKDLCSSKEYHRRHKVCDVHSKTAKVIVNGLEQRFCQQCSRFHLLGEFDDVKRSCRRRLAGHNERRRKPQVGLHSGRAGRLLHSYNNDDGFGGTRPNGTTTVTATSFICQDILPASAEKCGVLDSCKHPKLEDGAGFASKLACSWVDGQFMQKPVACPYSESLNASTLTANVFNNENNFNQYGHPHDNASCSLLHFDTASAVQGLPELSNKSGCALSLLSSQLNHHSSGMPTSSHPLIVPVNGGGSHHDFGPSEACQDPFGNIGNAASVGSAAFSGGFLLHGSEYVSTKEGPSFDGGPTIDLLQLSSQLQRVEHQRQAVSVSVKQEDDAFCCLKIT